MFPKSRFRLNALHPLIRGIALAALLAWVAEGAIADSPTADSPGAEQNSEKGRKMQSRVYKDLEPDDPWVEFGQEHLFAEVWTRPGLSVKQRRLISLTVAASVGSPQGISSHLVGGLESGDFSEEELWEWLIHFTHYAGYPKAAVAWAEYRKVLADRGSKPLPKDGIN